MDIYDAFQLEADTRNRNALREWLNDIQDIPATREDAYKHVVDAVTTYVAKNGLIDADYGLLDVNEFLLHRFNRFRGQHRYSTEIRWMRELLKTIPPVVTWFQVQDERNAR